MAQMAEKMLLNEDNKWMIVQCATFSKSLNPRNINKSVSDIRIRIRFPFQSRFRISVSGCKLTILPDIQPANRIVIISATDSCCCRNWKVTPDPGPFFSQIFDSGSGSGGKTQNPAAVDSGYPDPVPPLINIWSGRTFFEIQSDPDRVLNCRIWLDRDRKLNHFRPRKPIYWLALFWPQLARRLS